MKKPLTLLTVAAAAGLAVGFGPRIWAEPPATPETTASQPGDTKPDRPHHDWGDGRGGEGHGPCPQRGGFGHGDKFGPRGKFGPGEKIRGGPGHGPMTGEMLNLTDEQKAGVKALMEANRPKMEAIRKEAEEKMSALMEETQKQIRPLLTPAQQQVMDDAQKLREDSKKLHEENKAPATP